MTKILRTLFVAHFAVCFLFLSGCAFQKRPSEVTGIRSDSLKSVKVEPAARPLFVQAEKQFQNKDYERALKTYHSTRTKFPGGRAAQLSSYRIASIYYYREQYADAAREFEVFLAKYPNSELAFDVTYNLAAAEHQRGNFQKAKEALARLRPGEIEAQGPRRAEVVYQLRAQIATSQGDHVGAVSAFASKLQLPLTENDRAGTEEAFDAELARIVSVSELQRLSSEITEPTSQAKIKSRLVALTAFPAAGMSPIAPSGSGNQAEENFAAAPQGDSSGDRWSVGVVLPLTGKFAPYGRKALEGILLAAQNYGSQNSEIQVYVEDSQSNPTIAAAAAENLIDEHRVMAIIGPLSFRESVSVAQRAQGAGVVNISLSAKEGIAGRGGFLFQNALTPRVQLESLVQYAVVSRGFKRFAVLSPDTLYGKDMSAEFFSLVEQAGGKVVGYGSYAPEETDFQGVVQELVGLNPKYRRMELSKLAEWAKEQKAKGGREPKTRLVPFVDFEAVFIPDNPRTVATIAASLAYFDVTKVALLGTTDWNSDVLVKRGGRYVEGACFPGTVRADSENEFGKSYLAAYGSTPDLLATQSYEAMTLLKKGIVSAGSSSRESLAREIAKIRDFDSPLGRLAFDEGRTARRRLPIFSLVAGGKITQVQ